jgi:hypothetical protein
MVWDGRDLYVIEPARDAAPHVVGPAPAAGDVPVVYRLSDTQTPAGSATCAVQSIPGYAAPVATAASGLDAYRTLVAELQDAAGTAGGGAPPTAQQNATRRLQLSVVGDYELGQLFGLASARDRIIARINNLDGIFAQQVGVQLEIVGAVRVFDTPTQPFSSNVPSTLLGEVANYRASLSQAGTPAGGLTHLVTGRDLDGTTVGIAYLGSLCSTRFGAALSEGRGSATQADLVAAHEIGHNFGAPHDGETPSDGSANPCQAVPETFLMAPRINGSRTFSQCSLDQMSPVVQRAACLLPANVAPSVDLAASAAATTARAYPQRDVALVATVANAGTAAATNARFALSLPSGFTGGAVATGGGTCTASATSIDCTWPTLAAAANATVTATLRGATAGTYTLTGRTTATGDANAANDVVTYTVTIDPLPDLALSIPLATASATVDQSTSVAAQVRNAGATAAAGGTLTADLPAVLRAGAALPSGCTASGARIACTLGTLTAGEARTVTLPVVGASAGRANVAFALASGDDGTPGNNAGTVDVTVAAAAAVTPPGPAPAPAPAPAPLPSSGGGGGGSLDALGLLALALLAAARTRRRRAA